MKIILLFFVITQFLLSQEPTENKNELVKLIHDYLFVDNWEERLDYVKNPDNINEIMKDYYKNSKFPIDSNSVIEILEPKKNKLDLMEWSSVWVKLKKGDREWAYEYYIQNTKNGLKIDWLASIGYNEITAIAIIANLDKGIHKFRVYSKLTENYSSKFDKLDFYKIFLRDTEDNVLGYCYIKKNSVDGQDIFNILKDGKWHKMMLELQLYDGDDFVINSVINNSTWIEYP